MNLIFDEINNIYLPYNHKRYELKYHASNLKKSLARLFMFIRVFK